MSEKIYTISELNHEIRSLLENNYSSVWIEGEISNLARPSSGHLYFSLKDNNACVRCAMFHLRNRQINFQLDNGMKVLVKARVSLYEPRGDYQLIVEYLEELGDGILQKRFEALKNQLSAEGLFDARHKKSLPRIPSTVGIITSPTGAAIRDILSVLKRRFPQISIIIYPTAVQGGQAAGQIVRAVQLANTRKECEVIILARGGGSLEDLWPFNEEVVARAIASSEIPIVSGVGHEIDFTIADFVADHRAPTPSAAAELISPDQTDIISKIKKYEQQMTGHMSRQFAQFQQQIEWLSKRLRHPRQMLEEKLQRLDEIEQRLKRAMHQYLQYIKTQLSHVARNLDTLSPLATLHRGYAIVSKKDTGEILRSTSSVQIGERILNRLDQGTLECVIENFTVE